MRSDNSALSTVSDALGIGAAKVDTAYAGMEATIKVVQEIKDKLILAQDPTADKKKIQKEIGQLQKQLTSIADSATFNGENWLKTKASNDGVAFAAGTDDAAIANLKKQVVASFTRDSAGAVKVQRVDVQLSGSNVLFDTGAVTDGKGTGILDKDAVAVHFEPRYFGPVDLQGRWRHDARHRRCHGQRHPRQAHQPRRQAA